MLVEIQLVADLFVKANQQCVTIDNASSIPPNIMFATQKKLSTIEFCTDDIIKIIKFLNRGKSNQYY